MSLTATERTSIIELTTLMFNAAPGAVYLGQIDTLFESNGRSLSTLASLLAQTSIYTSLNPGFQTSAEFAVKFLTPLGLQGDATATDFIVSRLNSGASKASVVVAAMNALDGLDPAASAQYQAAKAILTNKTTVAEFYSATLLGSATDLVTLQNVVGGVTADAASVQAAENALSAVSGQTFTLTTGVDNIVGTIGNDTINGSGTTFTGLDSIDGGQGSNTFNLTDVATGGSIAIPLGVTVKNIQTVNITSTESVGGTTAVPPATGPLLDFSGIAGLTTINVSSIGSDNIKASATTNVTVTDVGLGDGGVTATSLAAVSGGNNVSIAVTSGGAGLGASISADGTAGALTISQATGGSIAVGGTTAVKGSVSITDTNLKGNPIAVDGGTTVDVTASSKGGGGTITIGNATKPTGAVTVTENLTGVTTADNTAGLITVKGGTTVSVTQSATQPLVTATAPGAANHTATQGNVAVTGGSLTTSVNVSETTAVGPVNSVLAATESGVATFNSMVAGQSVTVGGLTFVATGAVTAAQAAAAFAGLAAGATAGASTLGTYLGTLNGWSTGVVSTTSVTFTSATAGTNVTDLAAASTGGVAAPGIVNTQGQAATGTGGIANGSVTVTDVNNLSTTAAGTITSATISGYTTATFNDNALTNLGAANGGNITIANGNLTTPTNTTLNLTVNNVSGALADAGVYKTLNIATVTKDSVLAVNASAATTLAVSGTNALDLSGSGVGLNALKTVTVSGAAGVNINVSGAASLTDFNASATSGNNTVTIDASKATFEGGTGSDVVTLSSTTVSHAISMGDGNDTLILASGTGVPTAAVSGGTGTDTLQMTAADAVLNSANALFASKVGGFEVLSLTGGAAAQTVHVDVLGGFNSVTTGGEAAGGVLTLDGLTSGGTLTLTSASTGAYAVTNTAAFATPTTDVFNVALSNAGQLAAGTVTINQVETINIADNAKGTAASPDTLTLVGDSVTNIVITGAGSLNLTSANTTVTSVDASAMTGGLQYTTAGTTVETVHGGAAANALTAHAGGVADTLIGGVSNDLLTANGATDTLTGAGGFDTFLIPVAPFNLNSYSTVTDANRGDVVQLGINDASIAKLTVTLLPTAVFQDFANAAIANSVAGAVTWFQFGGDTYMVDNVSGSATSFVNTTDLVVKLTGIVDLSHASIIPVLGHGAVLIG